MKHLLGLTLAFAALPALTFAGDVKSGLQKGDAAGFFLVKDITGPKKGESLCYRCSLGTAPVINIQTRAVTDEVVSLVKQLDGLVDSPAKDGKGLKNGKHSFVVLITEDPDQGGEKLGEVAKKQEIKNIPLTIFDRKSGPKGYKIAKDAEVTVMFWTKRKATHNFAFAKGELDKKAVEKIVAAAKENLSKPAAKKGAQKKAAK